MSEHLERGDISAHAFHLQDHLEVRGAQDSLPAMSRDHIRVERGTILMAMKTGPGDLRDLLNRMDDYVIAPQEKNWLSSSLKTRNPKISIRGLCDVINVTYTGLEKALLRSLRLVQIDHHHHRPLHKYC
jgi:hypothetical protein